MKKALSVVADLLAAGLSLTGMGLVLVAAYLGGGGIWNDLSIAFAGVVLLAVGMIYLFRRDSAVSNKMLGVLKALFNST